MIVVTTPTGAIGAQVAENLLSRSQPIRVIARDPSRLGARVRREAEIVEGSHGDASVVDRAFEGASAVFWLPPPTPQADSLDEVYAGFAAPARAALRKHGVGHLVSVSALGRGTPFEKSAGLVTASLETDDLFAETGINFRALVMPSFMDNILRQAVSLRERGEFTLPSEPDRKAPTCATRDIASAAADLLSDLSWTGQGEQAVLGPEDLSPNDMAHIMTEVLGRPVTFRETPLDGFEAAMRGRGMSPAYARGYAAMMTAKHGGMDNFQPRDAVNTTPTSFRAWCEAVLKPTVIG